jgi:two-component system NtrC family sensor kinase
LRLKNTNRQTVLVVDDDKTARELICRKLRKFCSVMPVASGHEALERIRTGEIDLVIMDVMMPGLDGYQTCRRIKAETKNEFVPVILVTALLEQEDRNRGLAAGADEFLSKPVNTQELRLRVKSLLRIREQEQTIYRQARELERAVVDITVHSEELERAVRERTNDLQRQNRFIHEIIDSLPLSLYVVDRERIVVAWNRSRELGRLGLPREEALGRSVYELLRKTPRDLIEAELTRVFESGEGLSFECDSGEGDKTRHYRIHKIPMSVEPGVVSHVLTIGEDITEQRRFQKSIAMADKVSAVGRLAAGVAHEVNNPLATIVTCAQGLQQRLEELPEIARDSADFREYLDIVEQEAFRAKKITENMLDFTRAKDSPRSPQMLENIIERTLLILRHQARFKRVEVERRLDPDLPPVDVEEEALVQVLVALIINALDAMPDGGRLTLVTRCRYGEVYCEVADSGCGISPSDLPKIFDPFFTTKPPGHGTGLGLAVCYSIVESHGGRIEVSSAPEGGSRFTIVLPVAQTETAAVEEAV